MKLRVLDLFSGIGGFSLGLDRAQLEGAPYDGFETVAFCEIEEFPRRVLAKHWPGVPCYTDVRDLTGKRLSTDGIAVDVICGGFPCQDISFAGKGLGLAGERSGLWSEIARLAGQLRPSFIILENVAALLGRGLGDVIGDLAALGYDAQWHCIPASAVGAPHRRDRIWIVAYPGIDGFQGLGDGRDAGTSAVNDARCQVGGISEAAAIADAICRQLAQFGQAGRMGGQEPFSRDGYWPLPSEPFVRGGTHGVPDRAHRLRALGNAVVPQIPELIGNAILKALHHSDIRRAA